MAGSTLTRRLSQIDWVVLGTTFCICAMGVVVLYSAGYNSELGYSPSARRQLISMGIGFVALTVCAVLHPSFWRRWSFLFYGIAGLLLIAILFNGVSAGGARRWLVVAGVRMQPSELMKLGIILALARLFTAESAPSDGYGFWRLLLPATVLCVPVLLTVVEPDLGTGLCQLLIGGSMLLLAGIRPKILFRFILLGIIAMPLLWEFGMKEYQRKRVLTFLSPEADPLGSGYHAIQSKIAVGSGALTGKGFLEGTQTQLRFLPEQTTDFIFSVLAEEWGFMGSMLLLGLYTVLILRLMYIGGNHQDRFIGFVSFGVAAMLFWHVVINIGMVIGVVPVVGLTLALFSYGGSSLITMLVALGIVIGGSARKYSFS